MMNATSPAVKSSPMQTDAISAMPEITSSVISFFVPPSSKKCSSFSIASFTEVTPFCNIGGYGLIIHMEV